MHGNTGQEGEIGGDGGVIVWFISYNVRVDDDGERHIISQGLRGANEAEHDEEDDEVDE